jgi:hypothetical protein
MASTTITLQVGANSIVITPASITLQCGANVLALTPAGIELAAGGALNIVAAGACTINAPSVSIN